MVSMHDASRSLALGMWNCMRAALQSCIGVDFCESFLDLDTWQSLQY